MPFALRVLQCFLNGFVLEVSTSVLLALFCVLLKTREYTLNGLYSHPQRTFFHHLIFFFKKKQQLKNNNNKKNGLALVSLFYYLVTE